MTPEPEKPKDEPAPAKPGRRNALLWITGGIGAAAAAALGVPLAAFTFSVVKDHPEIWIPVGPLSDFPVNETRLAIFPLPDKLSQPWDGPAGKGGAYVRYIGKDQTGTEQFWVFAMNCTHLGCPVSWFPQSGLFMCPCHGGVYYENGEHASGPPPRGLYKMPWRLVDGVLEVQAPHLPTLQDTLERPSKLVQLGLMDRKTIV